MIAGVRVQACSRGSGGDASDAAWQGAGVPPGRYAALNVSKRSAR
jgi:hypothetical protein